MDIATDKGAALLSFLKAAATLRRKRISSYGASDRLIWFAEIPNDRSECRSPFLSDKPGEYGDLWLEIRKKRIPTRPVLPEQIAKWVRFDDLEQADKEPELLSEITLLIDQEFPDPDAPPESGKTVIEKRPKVERLHDHPEIEEAWLEYLINFWEPWAKEMRRWQEIQQIYEDLDFMRRRLEESEERYELLLAVGLLQWRDPTGTSIKRHLLTAPAEISFDAARGVLTVIPAASFDGLRIELDMLELQNQPRLDSVAIENQLDELDIQAWDTTRLGQIVREIANRLHSDAQVDENALRPSERSEDYPRVSYAPALVLRERQPTAYDDLLRKLSEITNTAHMEPTQPWLRILDEGELRSGASDVSEFVPQANESSALLDRYLFPLPTNEEQRQIVQRLQVEPCVLVKGPPGTGKSHTIANLICHLLALGDRVLVTAHAPKALAVLRGLLPDDIRDLCVTSLGSSRDDHRLLEESVRGILRRKNAWRGSLWAQQTTAYAEEHLQQVESELALVERQLRECREAETYPHTLPGGYQGTAAQIAQRLNRECDDYNWFPVPEEGCDEAPFPLKPEEIPFLVEVHGECNKEKLEELRLEVGDLQLTNPDEFDLLVRELITAEDAAGKASISAEAEKIEILSNISLESLAQLHKSIVAIEEYNARAIRVLGELSQIIIADLIVGNVEGWNRLLLDTGVLLDNANKLRKQLGSIQVEIPVDYHRDRLRTDTERRRAHFDQGGRRGFSIFSPSVVKETRYVEAQCLVDGQKPKALPLLAKVEDFLKLEHYIKEFTRLWPTPLSEISDPRLAVIKAGDLRNELQLLLRLFDAPFRASLDCIPIGERASLASQNERLNWLIAARTESARRIARAAKESLQVVLNRVRQCQVAEFPHPCLAEMAHAIQSLDTKAWRFAWEEREKARTAKERFSRYQELVNKFETSFPSVAELFRKTAGNSAWKGKLLNIEKAWAWASGRSWLRRVSSSETYKALVREFHRLQRKVEKATEELASIRAWRAFFNRFDNATEQSLNAWMKAIDRIGKGTGKFAYRHRRTARKYLMDCVPKIPAWVMPLHKLWDTVDAQPGIFDTVIVDEASQAGIDSLALLLLAKRIIVVGDDKQNSPEAVGILEEDIARIAREHLGLFRFRDEFRPDTSLFDHAERTFGNHISLREHFRCVPEIIRFSNDLCYRDAPLIPLRQAPPNRLPPIKSRYIPEGTCEGEGQRIRNRAEAETLVKVIQSLTNDEAYEGKTIGVIALQGHAQAELIENLLVKRLDPKIIEERKLRCGEAATFQGDQRDIIFLSLVIAPNVHFRALGRLPDQRRFNVAMSRARDQVWLFHCVQQHDMSPEDLRRKLLNFFESTGREALNQLSEDLNRLEREVRGQRRRGNQPEPYESWFEVDVALELLRRKYAVRSQVEIASKRIDLVVDGPDARLAVECDGDEWHGAEQYEYDMARQRQLERAGWTFIRVRESDFYADRQGAITAIIDACLELGIYPLDHIGDFGLKSNIDEEKKNTFTEEGDTSGTNESSRVEQEPVTEPDISTSEYGPFSGYSEESGHPDPRETSTINIKVVLRQIIEREGPLSRSSAYRLYVEGCSSCQRVGSAVRQALNKALGAMLRAGEVVQEDEFSNGSFEGQIVRLAGTSKVKLRPAGRRDLLDIPPSEILSIIEHISSTTSEIIENDESILRGILEHYGFSRLTRPRRSYLTKILHLQKTKHMIQ